MSDHRDTALGTALSKLPIPDHRTGFWAAVEADLSGSPIADQGSQPTTDSEPPVSFPRVTPGSPRRGPRWAWAFAAAAVIAIAIGVVAGLQLFKGDPGPMIDETVTTTILPATTTSQLPGTTTPGESGPPPEGATGAPTFVAVDPEAAGRYPSLVVGADGIPVVLYTTGLDERPFRIAACADSACSGMPTITPVDTSTTLAEYPPVMELAPDGLPVYVWSDFVPDGPREARLFKCADPGCTTGRVSELGPGDGHQLAVGDDNLPIVLFATGQATAVLVKCSDPACENSSTTTIEENLRGQAGPPKIAAGPGSLPVIATSRAGIDGNAPQVTILRCSDPDCAGEILVTETGVPANGIEDLVVTSDGVPVILTVSAPQGAEQGAGDLVLIGCDGPDCGSPAVTTITQASGPEILGQGRFGSIAVAADGRVSIAFADQTITGRVLTVATCAEPACEGGVTQSPTQKVDEWVWLSMALNPAGNPVVAYNSFGQLNMMLCSDPACTAPDFELPPTVPNEDWTSRVIDAGGAVLEGMNPTVLVDDEGLPTIVYYTDNGAVLVSCNDLDCESSTSTTLENGGQASAALRSNGLPVVVAMTTEWDGVELTLCEDRACNDRRAIRVAEGWVNGPPAVAVSPDGPIVVAYQHPDDWYVRVVTCLDESCTETTEGKLESLADPGEGEFPTRWWPNTIRLTVGDDFLPVIVVAQADATVRAVKCTDPVCSESTTVTLADTGSDKVTADMTIGRSRGSSNPLVAFYNDGALQVAACHDPACLDFSVSTIDDAVNESIASVGPAIEIGSDGLALIAYWTPTREVKLARCLNELCTESRLADVADLNSFDLALSPDGSPVLAYYQASAEGHDPVSGQGNDMLLARCNAGTCTED